MRRLACSAATVWLVATGCRATADREPGVADKGEPAGNESIFDLEVEVLAAERFAPDRIAVAGDRVYWTEPLAGNVLEVPASGGEITAVATAQAVPSGVFASAGTIYWANNGDGDDMVVGSVDSAILTGSGGGAVELFTEQLNATDLVLDGDRVYWTNHGSDELGYVDGAVMRASLAGGEPEALAIDLHAPVGIAISDGAVFWCNSGSDAQLADGSVYRHRDGATEVVASGQSLPVDIAADSDAVYWTNLGDGSVAQAGVGPIATGQEHVWGIDIDATHVYWANESGTVARVARDGGEVEVLLVTDGSPHDLEVTDTHVYYTDIARGDVIRFRKPPM